MLDAVPLQVKEAHFFAGRSQSLNSLFPIRIVHGDDRDMALTIDAVAVAAAASVIFHTSTAAHGRMRFCYSFSFMSKFDRMQREILLLLGV
jgi:hypothetical protein